MLLPIYGLQDVGADRKGVMGLGTYICLVCGAEVDVDLERNLIQCTKCGSRILMKPRPPALKKRVPAI